MNSELQLYHERVDDIPLLVGVMTKLGLSEVIDRVEHHHERVVVTRNGKPAAVIMSPEDLAELQETIDVLSDPLALADIREADASYARGDVVRGIDAVRQLRP